MKKVIKNKAVSKAPSNKAVAAAPLNGAHQDERVVTVGNGSRPRLYAHDAGSARVNGDGDDVLILPYSQAARIKINGSEFQLYAADADCVRTNSQGVIEVVAGQALMIVNGKQAAEKVATGYYTIQPIDKTPVFESEAKAKRPYTLTRHAHARTRLRNITSQGYQVMYILSGSVCARDAHKFTALDFSPPVGTKNIKTDLDGFVQIGCGQLLRLNENVELETRDDDCVFLLIDHAPLTTA